MKRMRKEWQAMQVQVVGQVSEVVQGNLGKYTPPVDLMTVNYQEPE
ncbi:MAG TPA: hypothetical protein VF168_13270 [Trueperaceae bacterium]